MLPGRLPTKRVPQGGFWSMEKEREVGLGSSMGDLGDVEAVELGPTGGTGPAGEVASGFDVVVALLSRRRLPKREAKPVWAAEAEEGGEVVAGTSDFG